MFQALFVHLQIRGGANLFQRVHGFVPSVVQQRLFAFPPMRYEDLTEVRHNRCFHGLSLKGRICRR
jgi:hypothetical protein